MLSKRLLEISKMITENEVVYDVGSDHGLLPCFLVTNNICKKAYASDNKDGPLSKAKENIEKFNLTGKVVPILADGIEKIRDDVTTITIAGMGFHTVKHILDGKDLSKYKKIIVQVNKDVPSLRRYISDRHFTIIDEKVVHDDFYYEIVAFSPEYHEKYSEKEIEFGPILMKNSENIYLEYLNSRKNMYLSIYKKAHKEEYLEKARKIEELIDIINKTRSN
ncbi:MAG: class I SAM-dependent methyltransferase [Erysipelotrichaceae bacterium]|nr:class I SAM-dependent methyltransferase [Erysipelotrichaceae bacterium]